jgi:integrase
MQQATRTLWEPGSLKQITFETLIGLLACTGLRIGEALRLTLGDSHLDSDPPHLEIRDTKCGTAPGPMSVLCSPTSPCTWVTWVPLRRTTI